MTQVSRNAPDEEGSLREREAACRSERERYWRRRRRRRSYRGWDFEEEDKRNHREPKKNLRIWTPRVGS